MRKATNNENLIILSKDELAKLLKAEFEKGAASVSETVSHSKDEIKTSTGKKQIRKAVVEDEQHAEVTE